MPASERHPTHSAPLRIVHAAQSPRHGRFDLHPHGLASDTPLLGHLLKRHATSGESVDQSRHTGGVGSNRTLLPEYLPLPLFRPLGQSVCSYA